MNKHFLLKKILVIAQNNNAENISKKVPIFHYININKIEKLNILDFEEWFYTLINNDHEYIKSYDYYGFRLFFSEFSHNFSNDIIYPTYPWNSKFIELYIPNKEIDYYNSEYYLKKIKKLQKEILILKKKRRNPRLYRW